MKILCISDTHGDIDLINTIIKECPETVDCVIHAGDFGFYDKKSVNRLQPRELQLRIKHDYSIPQEERKIKCKLEGAPLKKYIKEKAPLSSLPDYISKKKKFEKPVFAVWGNHDDFQLVKEIRYGKVKCPNLHILDENNQYDLGEGRVLLWGLGGNLLPTNANFYSKVGIIGDGGKISSSLHQYGTLINNVKKFKKQHNGVSICVTHVSPGKEVFLTKLGDYLRPNFMISGHMGAPWCNFWNEFTIREDKESDRIVKRVSHMIENSQKYVNDKLLKTNEDYKAGVEFMKKSSSRCFNSKFTSYMNLPDAKEMGYSVMTINDDGTVSINMYSKGKKVGPSTVNKKFAIKKL